MYTAGLRNKRITIHTPGGYVDDEYGRTVAPGGQFQRWAGVTWTKGAKAMQEGTLDAYGVILVRTDYDSRITRDCKVEYDGRMYRIQDFRPDRQENTIQMLCSELQQGEEKNQS